MIYTYSFHWRCLKCKATGEGVDQLAALSIAGQHQHGCGGAVEIFPVSKPCTDEVPADHFLRIES